MKLADFISQQAVKAGIDVNADANKAFFEALAGVTNEVPDDMAKVIDNKFITIESAKNNHPDIKNHYTKQALDTVDKGYLAVLQELQVPQDVIDQVMSEQSTFKKGPLMAKTIQSLEAKKAAASSPDKAAIQKQIDDLQAQLKAEKETTQKTLADKALFEKNMRLQYKKNSLFSNLKTIYDSLDPDEKFGTLDVILNKALQDNNAHMDFDDNGNLVLLKKDGTNYFGDNNTQINPQQYIDALLSRKKLLITQANPAPAGGANQPNPANPAAPASANGNRNGSGGATPSIYKEHLETALKELTAPAAM